METTTAATATGAGQLRNSHGLEQLSTALREQPGQAVLDLGEFTQPNVTYLTSLGHRLYSENFLHTLDMVFGPGDPAVNQQDPHKAQAFLDQVLQYESEQFDAALVWDTLEYLSKPLLTVVMDRLYSILKPRAVLLACFHADVREEHVSTFSYRIADSKTLALYPKGRRKPAQPFNNRTIEKLFERFGSVKFFLTRDNLREVILRR